MFPTTPPPPASHFWHPSRADEGFFNISFPFPPSFHYLLYHAFFSNILINSDMNDMALCWQ